MDNTKRFIVVTLGVPVHVEGGHAVNTSGVLGVLLEDNVYLDIYAAYEDKRHTALEVDERCRATFRLSSESRATFRLSSEKGSYEVVRIS